MIVNDRLDGSEPSHCTVSNMSRRRQSFKAKRQNSNNAHDSHFTDLSIGDGPDTS